MCPNCGSYVIKMESRERKWLKLALPGVVVALAAIFFVLLYVQDMDIEPLPPQSRELDPLAAQTVKTDELLRERGEVSRRTRDTIRKKSEEERRAKAEWEAMPPEQQRTWLETQREAHDRAIGVLRPDATPETVVKLDALAAQLQVVSTFLDSEQYGTARQILDDVRGKLEALSPRSEDLGPAAK
jgi:hypothetical protein